MSVVKLKKIIAATTLSISILGLAACGGGSETVVDSKAGKITKDDFYEALQEQNGAEVLTELITFKVLEDKYEVSDDEVQKEYDKLKEQVGEDFDSILEMQGLTEDELKEDIRKGLLNEKALTEGIEVTDEEIESYYENMKTEVKASHILVDDEETANKVKKELDDGADYAKLAKKYSTDEANKDKGGDLGYFTVGTMVGEFEEKAFTMEKDEISEPVASDFGFHIILVTDKKETEEEIGSLEDEKEEIRQVLLERKIDPQEAATKIDDLIKDADVDIKIDEFKDILDAPEMPEIQG